MNLRCLFLASLLLPLLPGSGALAQGQLQTGPAQALPGNQNPVVSSRVPGVMPAAQAFALSAFVEADTDIALLWEMPPAYYLYRTSLQLELADGTVLNNFIVPPGTTVEDEFFGASEVYFDRLLLRLPLAEVPAQAFSAAANGGRQIDLLVLYQGCAQDKYCYPPQRQPVTLELP